ncbi:MAG: DUF493 domain-containing protein [Cyclobacteriaceae bacterium]|nr:DUF493 domain-containing protein [Cyclobacteriaceae bacterium]MCK5707714.1 DUF493 domain-containing protein [Candidatus Auribacterota bacterium]
MKKPIINYPCKWSYKVIGSDQAFLAEEILNKLKHIKFEINLSNQSSQGTYVSFKIEAYVNSENERIDIFNVLKDIPTVKFVI